MSKFKIGDRVLISHENDVHRVTSIGKEHNKYDYWVGNINNSKYEIPVNEHELTLSDFDERELPLLNFMSRDPEFKEQYFSEEVLIYFKTHAIVGYLATDEGKQWLNTREAAIDIENAIGWLPIPRYREESQ